MKKRTLDRFACCVSASGRQMDGQNLLAIEGRLKKTVIMEITRKAKRKIADVEIWQCRGCDVVHLGVGGTIVNFTREDFTSFTEDVVSICYSGWGVEKNSVIDLIAHDADN